MYSQNGQNGGGYKLVWNNPNPTQSIGQINTDIDLSQYTDEMIFIKYYHDITKSDKHISYIGVAIDDIRYEISLGGSHRFFICSSKSDVIYGRQLEITNNKLVISGGNYSNNFLVPIEIYIGKNRLG